MNWWEKLRRHWRKLHVKTWMLVVVMLLGAMSSVFFLRQNNLKMIELRDGVIKADKEGGIADVRLALAVLNKHVFSHMNTEIVRPIELVETYSRARKKAIEDASQTSNRDIYAEATAACERRGVMLSQVAQCAADYALQNNPGVGPKEIKLPNKDLFTYSFAPPLWTPDAAGFSILITGVVMIWLIGRLLEFIFIRMLMRWRIKRDF